MEKELRVKKPRKREHAFFPIAIWTLILLWVITFLFVLAWAIIQSFKSDVGFWFDKVGFPSKEYGGWQWKNYSLVFTEVKIPAADGQLIYLPTMLWNTLYYCIGNGFFSVFSPMICSYIYAKYSKRVRWTKILWGIMLVNLYVPLSASLAASLVFAMKLGFYDNIYLYIVTSFTGFTSNFLIYYATWKGVSWDYAEAAFMDGASHTTILFKIMLPMTRTVFGVLFVSSIIALWTNYETSMVFLPSYPTIAYGVYYFQNQTGSAAVGNIPVRLAAIMTAAFPMLVLFLSFKNKMMGSLTMGGLKG